MSPQTIRILIAGALLVHGVGHTLGYWRPASTILFFRAPEPFLKIAGGAFWSAAAIGFILASMSFFGILLPSGWWRTLAIVFAVISLLGLVLFGRSWPVSNFIGAFGLNIVILVALLWLHWPPVEMFNR
jgi:hypothetical protein